jgi:hypothetical protein
MNSLGMRLHNHQQPDTQAGLQLPAMVVCPAKFHMDIFLYPYYTGLVLC